MPQRCKHSITKPPVSIRRAWEANIFDTLKIDLACIENWPSLHSTQHALYALSTLILTVVSIVDFHAMNIRNPTSSLSQIEFTLPGIHKTRELFNYRNLFLRESISFVTQLHEDSCQRLFFPWFCPPIPKFALTLIKEWGNNIAPRKGIKECESSTFSLNKFFSNFVDVAEPVWGCAGQTGEHYTVKLFR